MPAVRPDLRLGLAVFVVATAATGAGIAVATSRNRDVDSGIAGRVLCPVVLAGGADCSQIRVSVRDRSSDRRVATVKPSRFGRFRVALAPGAYLLELQRLQVAPAGRTTRIDVRVPPHAFVRTTIAASPMTPLR